jgi:serine/threonine protein kinase
MELCGGGSVQDLYKVLAKPLSEAQMQLLAKAALEALVYIHDSLHLIHRDLKSVCDFLIALSSSFLTSSRSCVPLGQLLADRRWHSEAQYDSG